MTKHFAVIILGLLLGVQSFAQVIPGGGTVAPGPSSAIVGNLQTATGGKVTGGTLSFSLSQPAVVSGTSTLVGSTVSCYTSSSGNIVGVPDPSVAPVVNATGATGTLPAGTYYVKYVYLGANGTSLASPESTIVLDTQGSLDVTAPAIQPTAATGFYAVYIGTSPGTETLQGVATGWTLFAQSTPLSAGSSLPSVNTSSCNVYFSDQLVPTGTYYTVSLTNKNGANIAGFPQTWCTYGGENATINVSNGAPVGNCGTNGVFYPSPIYANPQNDSSQSVSGPIAFPGGIFGPVTASGPWTFLSPVTFANINNTVFADQCFGVDASAKIQNCIALLPANGGVVNAQNLNDVGGTGTSTIDPGDRSVTILLGPYTYNFSQVILRTNLHIVGFGTGEGLNGSKVPTIIQATGGNSTAPFVLSQTVSEGQEDVILRGFRLLGTTGNTSQNGIFISAPANGGLWYSEFDDIFVQGFAGKGLDLESPLGGGLNQFSTFKRVVVIRNTGGSYALQIKGFNNSLKFENCQFDGSPQQVVGGDGLTNINIDDFTGGTFPPYNIKFDLLTTQWAGIAINIDAGDAISFDQLHAEGDFNVLTTGPGDSFGPLGITIHDSGIYTSGTNSGAGSIINNTASSGNAAIQMINSHIYAAPDVVFKGSNLASIYQCGITVGPEGSYNYLPCSNRSTGVIALATGAIGAHACTAAQTVAISGVATTSALTWSFTTTPVGVTGYGDATTPFLVVTVFPTANTGNAVVCNTSAGSITPGAISIRIAAQNTAP